jgi:NAD(P)-dependent dehydrogenase (short-subunit alcohol dehydrogenase family)
VKVAENEFALTNWWSLSGRTAVVIGGSGWLGLPIAAFLLEAGADVVIVGRDSDKLNSAKEILSRFEDRVSLRKCDVSQTDEVRALSRSLENTRLPVSILVNSFQASLPPESDVSTDHDFPSYIGREIAAHWRVIFELTPLLSVAQTTLGDASIINICSMYGKVSPQPAMYADTGIPVNPLFYGVSKAGLLQMTRWLAVSLASRKIRVNSISPGPFPQEAVQQESSKFINSISKRVPLGRIGRREEIGPAVVFLASTGASYITGSDLAVDGGWTAW